jgi:hypothetical protein
MVMAASGGNAHEDIMSFASNLTIDNEEYSEFNKSTPPTTSSKLPVHASTQEKAVTENFERASDSNKFELLQMLAHGVSTAAPGQ